MFLIAQNVLFKAGRKQKAKYAVLLESSIKNIDLKMIVGGGFNYAFSFTVKKRHCIFSSLP